MYLWSGKKWHYESHYPHPRDNLIILALKTVTLWISLSSHPQDSDTMNLIILILKVVTMNLIILILKAVTLWISLSSHPSLELKAVCDLLAKMHGFIHEVLQLQMKVIDLKLFLWGMMQCQLLYRTSIYRWWLMFSEVVPHVSVPGHLCRRGERDGWVSWVWQRTPGLCVSGPQPQP